MLDDGPMAFALGGAVRVGLALIFVQSGWQSVGDFAGHVGAVAAYRLVPAWAVAPVAGLLVAGNFAAAALLVPAATAWWGAAVGCALLISYAAAMKINLMRGRTDIACGCGGAGQKISGLLVARNLVLAGLLARASLCPLTGTGDWICVVAMVGGGISFAGLYFAAGQLLANDAALA